MSDNKAADRLRRWDCVDEAEFGALLDEALAAERRATVERIREALIAEGGLVGHYLGGVEHRILDKEAKR